MAGELEEVRSFVPEPENARLLRDAFGRFATGVAIVTVAGPEGPVAITVNSFSSVSLDPPLVLWSPDRRSRRFPHFEAAEHFAVHILEAGQGELCWKVVKDAYALSGLGLLPNSHGVPVIPHVLARFDCRREAVYEGGDHAIILGRVEQAELRETGDALAFFRGQVGRFLSA
ncbi:flavin reductase family protein [Poseidonocella sp. HB161398]|uniref:flavin reductase family protein n=1 Tax=Poseidonocella sp. HB161398 TaxID=2320855 RepID=UPI001109AA07|nr:flavin reductase family protein [Poseidonocella sp. HB161398]